jgi:hypothetical protein
VDKKWIKSAREREAIFGLFWPFGRFSFFLGHLELEANLFFNNYEKKLILSPTNINEDREAFRRQFIIQYNPESPKSTDPHRPSLY